MKIKLFSIISLTILLIWTVIVCAYAEKYNLIQGESDTMELTKEYMMAHCQLEEEDFAGIDFDDFVDYFKLNIETLDEFGGKSLLELYRHDMDVLSSIDYTFIYHQASGKLRPEDIPHVKVVIWELHKGNRNLNIIADFESLAVYGGEGYCIDRCDKTNRIADLTEDDIVFIRQAIIDSGIVNWENKYMGTSEGTTGHFAWAIGFQLDTGVCIKYSGSGVLDSGTPTEMHEFCKALWKRFVTENHP